MNLNEIRPHDTVGVANWRALQAAVRNKQPVIFQHDGSSKEYTSQEAQKIYRWAKLHLDRNEQHKVFDKLANAQLIAQLLPNIRLRETSASKTKFSRNEAGYKNWNEIQRAVRHSSSNPADPQHNARLRIDATEVLLSKSDAEKLFRWLKKNFKTTRERELYDFLSNSRLLDVLHRT